MAHIYTSNSVTMNDDQVTVVGSVDGIQVTVQFWASAVANMTSDERVAFVVDLMLNALPVPPADLTEQYPTTVTM